MKLTPEQELLVSSPGAKRWLTRKRLPRANALLPKTYSAARPSGFDPSRYVYSLDPDMLRATEELATKLTKEFPTDVTPEGFAGPSAVPGNFLAALSVSGYGMDPLPLPIVSNDEFVSSLGLTSQLRPGDGPWLNELIRLFFGAASPAALHIRKEASSGFPYFTSDNQYKKLSTLKALHHADDFLKAMTGGPADLKRALEEYHSLSLASINERQQPTAVSVKDGKFVGKMRIAPTEEAARTGSVKHFKEADLRVYDDAGRLVENHFAMRRRTVFGMPGVPNYFLTAILGCHRAVYLSRFEFTYKMRGPEDKERKMSRYRFAVGSDVKNMDTTVPRWFMEHLISELHQYWREDLVELLRRMFQAPYVVPPPWRVTPESYNPFFGPSPLSGEFNVWVGLPSGIAINPDIGKLWMTFVYIRLFRDAGALSAPSEIEGFLMGQNPNHALMDMSDDAALLTNSPSVLAHLKAAKSPYAVLEPETPLIYLGDVITSTAYGLRAYPNPVTYLVNEVAREDSIDRKDPVTYAEGVLARYQLYSRTPIFRDLNRIKEEIYRKHLGINPYLIARSVARRGSFVSDIDAMVKENPNVLYYKVDPADVSPEILDELVATIPAADFIEHIRPLLKMTIQG